MVLLKNLQLKNFLSHSDSELVFGENSRLLLDGKSGAGKSSFVEALVWAFFNQGRVQNRSLIKRGQKSMSVTVELLNSETQDIYQIQRSLSIPKKNANAVHEIKILKNKKVVAINGTRQIQDFLEKEIIHCSYSLFCNSVCYLQENLDSFVRQTPANRKDILLELVRADDYEIFYAKARDLITTLRGKLEGNAIHTEQLLNEIARSQMYLDNLPKYEADMEIVRNELDVVNNELKDLQEKEIALTQLKGEIDNLKRRATDIRENSVKIYRLRKDSEKLISELENIDLVVVKAKFQEAQDKQRELNALQIKLEERQRWQTELTQFISKKPFIKDFSTLISETEKELKKATEAPSSDLGEDCPHCGKSHPCERILSELSGRRARLESILVDFQAKEQENQRILSEYEDNLTGIKVREPQVDEMLINVLKLELSQLQPYIEKFYSSQDRDKLLEQHQLLAIQYGETLLQYDKDQFEIKEELVAKEAEQAGFGDLRSKKSEVNKLQQEIQIRLAETMELLTLGKSAKARKVDIDLELAKYSEDDKKLKERVENLELLKDALGQTGIRTIVLDYFLPLLEERINTVLGTVSSFKIQLDTQMENVTGEKQIEGLFINILNPQGESFDFLNYSGGERIKIIFAIAEGLATFSKIGWRILDEAVISLDEESGNLFAQAILAFREKFQQLLVISHVREIKDIFDQSITVVNINGDSKII